jgi:zinc transport system ATP-binding protein
MPLLEVRNLSVWIEKQSVINDLNFELETGEILSILGPNGAGKTVLLKALLNLIPYSGQISWSPDVRLGYVPQKIDADRHLPLTYRDLFTSKCRILKVAITKIGAIAASVGLTKQMLQTPVGHLSGGQFQRGLIGFALIGKPNVLLLDEPTSSLDEPGEEHIYELIHRLQHQYKLAVITVSHDLSFVYRHATRVLCLNRRSICMGAPQETLTPNILEKLYGPSYGYYHHDHDEQAAGDPILSMFSPELAAATGINVSRLNLYYLLIFSLTVLLGLRFLGALLVGALIIIPAATGRQLTHTLSKFLTVSSAVSVVSVIFGFAINRYYSQLRIGSIALNLSLGPAIISVATILFLLSLLSKKA